MFRSLQNHVENAWYVVTVKLPERVVYFLNLLRSGPSLLAAVNAIQAAEDLLDAAADTGERIQNYAESPHDMRLEARKQLVLARETLRNLL